MGLGSLQPQEAHRPKAHNHGMVVCSKYKLGWGGARATGITSRALFHSCEPSLFGSGQTALKLPFPSTCISETLLQAPNDHLSPSTHLLANFIVVQRYLLQEARPD